MFIIVLSFPPDFWEGRILKALALKNIHGRFATSSWNRQTLRSKDAKSPILKKVRVIPCSVLQLQQITLLCCQIAYGILRLL